MPISEGPVWTTVSIPVTFTEIEPPEDREFNFGLANVHIVHMRFQGIVLGKFRPAEIHPAHIRSSKVCRYILVSLRSAFERRAVQKFE